MRVLPQLNIIKKDLEGNRCIQLEGCVPSQLEFLLAELGEGFESTVIIAQDELKAAEIIANISPWDKNVSYYPALDPMFYKADIQGSYLSEQRTEVVRRLYEKERITVVTTLDAFYENVRSMSRIHQETITISPGDTIDPESLREHLVSLGYSFESQVSGHGEFSVRGGIIDIYPYACPSPYRIDLFGDEVETIKSIDVQSQRSVESVDEIIIFPGGDRADDQDPDAGAVPVVSDNEGITADTWKEEKSFLGYFQEIRTLFVILEPARILKSLLGMNPLSAADSSDESVLPEHFSEEKIRLAETVLSVISHKTCILSCALGETPEYTVPYRVHRINARSIPSYNGRFLDLVEDLKKYRKDGYQVQVICAGQTRVSNMIRNLAENGVTVGLIEADPGRKIRESDIQIIPGTVRNGFAYPDIGFAMITESDIFGTRNTRKKKKRYSGDPIKEFTDLNIGDYVVHEQHGVGVYQGMERIRTGGVEKDYMKIGYAGNSSLYVLATQFDKIQKYGASDGAKPKLNRLGGKEWASTKARVRSAVQDIAQDLVGLYAERQSRQGHRYSSDTVWQKEFEEDFEFEETQDQLNAIEDVKSDMESGRIMDRLICGDVGFGKTEVAIRAAFKAVQEGKQVAFLTPTTILAQQHYNTVVKRMENYPVTVKMLSRFVTAKEQKKTLADLAKGMVDIVIGTHRLLSKDVKFKDLGLLVIDEEQRFGVTHKEKIKQMRKNVDVITLSATPIPRTLHMSLTGIRDMSVLTEPPIDRIPIQTYVMEYSDDAVKEAVTRELLRGGQVYYVYNRTHNIDLVAEKIRSLVPGAEIAYAHGRMGGRELEQIMYDFVEGSIDVLVSTTIIETGLDIPNVNTIIIHDADNFGLSQLYQLRGRVGRSNRIAYAFLMFRKDKLIQEVAEKRLKAIREFSDLGSGIRIAMRDLEIRGAGNVLGAEQSGHMEAVGYELYCKMLNQAVALLKGETPEEDFETTVDLDIDGYIPAVYITNEFEKLNMYKKISAIETNEEIDDIRAELSDRFGPIPQVTDNLIQVAVIKSMAHKCYITEISGSRNEPGTAFKIMILPSAPVDTYRLLSVLREKEGELRFTAEKNPYFTYTPKGKISSLQEIKETLTEFFDILKQVLVSGDETPAE